MKQNRRTLGVRFQCAIGAVVAAIGLGMSDAEARFGNIGDPINLVIGYQPYYAQAWTGVVMREKEFWKDHLPEGSTVEFQIGLQGTIIVNAMLAGRQHIGYMGDMPAIVSTMQRRVDDIRLVANLGLGSDQCNIFLARADLDVPEDPVEAIRWLEGKQTAVPQGACTDRFARAAFQELGVTPAAYMNQNIEVISSNLRARRLDAAAIWEPTASKLIKDGLAKRIASGETVGERDAALMAMRADLIEARPDVVRGWLEAELDAQVFISDPANAAEVVAIVERQTAGFDEETLWMSLYGQYPSEVGGASIRNAYHFTFTPEVMELITAATAFLFEIRSINAAELPDDAILGHFAEEVLAARGMVAPVAEISALPASEAPGR